MTQQKRIRCNSALSLLERQLNSNTKTPKDVDSRFSKEKVILTQYDITRINKEITNLKNKL